MAFKPEIVALLPGNETIPIVPNPTQGLTEAISKLQITQTTKMPIFQKGENFSRYCERFQEYIYIAKIADPNLYMFFLQNLNDETYATLKSVILTDPEKADEKQFLNIYKKAIYGNEEIFLKNAVFECKQLPSESISDYAYKLREKATIAYQTMEDVEGNCLLVFLRGVRDLQIKRKLNEASPETFKEAVTTAKRLETIDIMLGEQAETDISPILRESNVSSKINQQPSSETRGRIPVRTIQSNSPHHDYSNSSNFNRHSRQNPHTATDRSRSSRPCRSPTPDRSRNKFHSPDKIQRNSANISCWNCGKRGHISRNCWSRREVPHSKSYLN